MAPSFSWIELNDPKVKLVGNLIQAEAIKEIGKAHDKSAAQVLLRWSTQRGITVIPKSSNPERLKENLDSTDFDLTEKEIQVSQSRCSRWATSHKSA